MDDPPPTHEANSSFENGSQTVTAIPDRARLPSPTDGAFDGLGLRGGDGSRGGDDDGEESFTEDEVPRPRQRGPASRRFPGVSKGEFQAGAIVRVKLQNFVTYEKAEFSLGPNLNMVIGPNGTGKSSLVCAICLGLGYPSSVLGRASAFGEFVKHGKDEAEIEVELQRKPEDSENYVVGLTIRKEDNSRKFTINGHKASQKQIQQLMQSLRIQIDNLCQFLPQDKVAEFAGLTPIELLEKTLHAAAPPEMIQWQAELKDHFKSQKDAQRSSEQSGEQLRKMEARQQVLQADVEKLQERKNIQESLATLETLLLISRYDVARKEFKAAKRRKREAEIKLKHLQQNSAPSLQAVNRKQEYLTQIQAVVDDRKVALRAAETAADESLGFVDAADGKAQDLQTKAEAERESFKTRRQEMGRIRKKITDFEAQYKQVPKEFDAADWNKRIRDQEHRLREKTREIDDAKREVGKIVDEGQEKRREYTKVLKDLQESESQQGQLLNQLRKADSDVAKGWEWVKDHQDEFEKEVFGPPMLTCSVKDPRYSDHIQSMLNKGDFLCFTTQTRNDHKKLSAVLFNQLKLSANIRSCFSTFDSFRPPLPKERLVAQGFDGYVTDFLEGPEPVLAMLCSEKRLHASAIALKTLSDDQLDQVTKDEAISQFACGSQTYRIIRRREYGPLAVTTRSNLIQKGRFWTDQPVDAGEKTELQRKGQELKSELAELKRRHDEQAELIKTLEEQKGEISAKIDLLRKEKGELQRQHSKWQTLPDKIDSEKRALRQKDEELGAGRARLREFEQQHAAAIIDKAKAVLLHQKRIGSIRTAWQALLEAQLLLIEAKSDVAFLKDRNSGIMQQLEAEKQSLNLTKGELEERKKKAQVAYEAVLPFLQDRNELLQAAQGRTVEDIEQEMGAERAKLEVIQANNPQALEEFESWARRIETETANHAMQETRLADLNEKINRVRSLWEPRLDELVGQINDAFSYNFEQISCAGEVGVHKDEDFDKWAIEIRVKFREDETLQRLDQHRQSGGERAVSTIFYLMSLQSMAQAPFRVVDEINQGMDPRNERMVHERMVEIACREHTSQYFLITPKLLSGLRYDSRMRVHTIVSGEHVEKEGTEKMNFAAFAKIHRKVMGR